MAPIDSPSQSTKQNAPNNAKYLAYKFAHERISAAIEAGFPLEAIAIQESLISDRLHSFTRHHGSRFDIKKTALRTLANKSLAICLALDDTAGQLLITSLIDWIARRNLIIHGIAKSPQGEGPELCPHDFLREATKVAKTGSLLARKTLSWHAKHVRLGRQ